MLLTVVTAYVVSAIVASVFVFVASKRMGDQRHPATHPAMLSLVAGLMWPVLLLGLVEYGTVAAYSRVSDHHQPPMRYGGMPMLTR